MFKISVFLSTKLTAYAVNLSIAIHRQQFIDNNSSNSNSSTKQFTDSTIHRFTEKIKTKFRDFPYKEKPKC